MFFWADRYFAQFADNWCIARVIGVHRDRAIPQHGFGARGGDRNVIARLFERDISVGVFFDIGIALAAREGVFKMPHMAVNFGILNLKIRDGRLKMRVPVDQSFATIDQTLVVHLDKNLEHRIMEICAVFMPCARIARCTSHGKGVA